MLDLPNWAPGVIYAGGGVAMGIWYLRELKRNEVLQDRLRAVMEAWSPVIPKKVTFGIYLVTAVAGWPALLFFILFNDVPGHGKNNN